MAEITITEMPEADTPLEAGAKIMVIQGGVNKQTTLKKAVKSMMGALDIDVDDDTWGIRAWGVFDGTQAIGDIEWDRAKGVESIEKTATGVYLVTLRGDVVDAIGNPDYVVNANANGANNNEVVSTEAVTSRTVRLRVRSGGSYADATYICFTIVG